MPIDYKQYHPKWTLIRRLIRRRAGNRCEWCSVPNGAIVYRPSPLSRTWRLKPDDASEAAAVRQLGYKFTQIVLTTAHLDGNRNNNRFWNLAYLCQRCHLRHDAKQHAESRRYGKNHREAQIKIDF